MCFSAEVDFVTAAVIAVPAVDAMRHAERPNEIPIAIVPTLFVVHSLASGLAWLGVDGSVSESLATAAEWVYVLIAFVVIPALVPLAVWCLEATGWRRRATGAVAFLGAVVGVIFLLRMLANGYVAIAHDDWIQWGVQGQGNGLLTAGYLLATCGVLLISGERWLIVYGVVNVVAVAATAAATREGFASIWCFWAALTSVFIAAYLRQRSESRRAT